MKKLYFLLFLLALAGYGYSQPVPRNVVVEHFTNTYCSICASLNPGFYTNLWQFPEVLHISYYPSAPYPACPLSQHNKPEANSRTNFYGVYGSTPRLVIQGSAISAGASCTDPSLFQSQLGHTTPYDLKISQKYLSATMIEVKTVVKKVDTSSITDLQLYAAIVEDTLFFNANNGEQTL